MIKGTRTSSTPNLTRDHRPQSYHPKVPGYSSLGGKTDFLIWFNQEKKRKTWSGVRTMVNGRQLCFFSCLFEMPLVGCSLLTEIKFRMVTIGKMAGPDTLGRVSRVGRASLWCPEVIYSRIPWSV